MGEAQSDFTGHSLKQEFTTRIRSGAAIISTLVAPLFALSLGAALYINGKVVAAI